MWDTVSDCLGEKGPAQELAVSKAVGFSEDEGELVLLCRDWLVRRPSATK